MNQSKARKHNTLVRSISKLYTSELYSDMTIKSSEKTYPAHRAIICPQSAWFETACRGDFKEAEDGLISLPEDDPQAIDIMMWYFYHQDYSAMVQEPSATTEGDEAPKNDNDDCALLVHVKVYALAEKLRILGLKTLALKKFKEVAEQYWASEVFLAAVEEAYTTVPANDHLLRETIADTFNLHPELLDIPTARETIKRIEGLAADILLRSHDQAKGNTDW